MSTTFVTNNCFCLFVCLFAFLYLFVVVIILFPKKNISMSFLVVIKIP